MSIYLSHAYTTTATFSYIQKAYISTSDDDKTNSAALPSEVSSTPRLKRLRKFSEISNKKEKTTAEQTNSAYIQERKKDHTAECLKQRLHDDLQRLRQSIAPTAAPKVAQLTSQLFFIQDDKAFQKCQEKQPVLDKIFVCAGETRNPTKQKELHQKANAIFEMYRPHILKYYVHHDLAMILLQMNEYSEAIGYFETFITEAQANEADIAASFALLQEIQSRIQSQPDGAVKNKMLSYANSSITMVQNERNVANCAKIGALLHLGWAYENGNYGAMQDAKKAKEYYKSGADCHSPTLQYRLGHLYMQQHKYQKAYRFLKLSANATSNTTDSEIKEAIRLANYELAMICLHEGELEKSILHFYRAMQRKYFDAIIKLKDLCLDRFAGISISIEKRRNLFYACKERANKEKDEDLLSQTEALQRDKSVAEFFVDIIAQKPKLVEAAPLKIEPVPTTSIAEKTEPQIPLPPRKRFFANHSPQLC